MKNYLAIFLVVLALFLTVFLLNNQITGFIVLDEDNVNFNLSRDTYLVNETLDGTIKLILDDNLDPETLLNIDIDNSEVVSLNMAEILELMLKEIEVVGGEYSASSKSNEKIIDSNSLFGFVVPIDSSIESFDFNVQGLSDTTNQFPGKINIDVGNDNSTDWYYIGQFQTFSSNVIKPVGLTDNRGNDAIIDSDTDLYCELFNLNFGNKFKINVDYTVQTAGGNLKATILQFENSDFAYSVVEEDCNLHGSGVYTNSCTIDSDKLLNGNHLVCVYNAINDGEYKLRTDVGSDSGYICDLTSLDSGSTSCDKAPGDFRITLSEAVYNDKLSTITGFEDWKLGEIEPNDLLEDASCGETDCVIPLKVNFVNGKIKINDARIRYKDRGVSFETGDVYSVSKSVPVITSIDGDELSNYSLVIPLSIFEINVVEDGNVEVSIGNFNEDIDFKVVEDLTDLANVNSDVLNERLDEINEKAENVLIDTYLDIKGVNLANLRTSLTTFENNVEALESRQLSFDQRFTEITKLEDGLRKDFENLPQRISVINEIKNVPSSLPDQITSDYINDDSDESKQAVLSIQDKVDISTTLGKIRVDNKVYTIVNRDIGNLDDIYVIEVIPKRVASNVNQILYLKNDAEVVEADPVLRFKGEVRYLIEGDVLLDASSISTLVVPNDLSSIKVEEVETAKCGDNVCTEFYEDSKVCPEDCKTTFSLTWIFILALIVIGGACYINFYKGKWNFSQLISVIMRRPYFYNDNDLINLKTYVIKSMRQGKSRNEITSVLLQKGWSKEQIDYAFNK